MVAQTLTRIVRIVMVRVIPVPAVGILAVGVLGIYLLCRRAFTAVR